MMAKIFVTISLILLLGCAPASDGSSSGAQENKVYDWQDREVLCLNGPRGHVEGVVELSLAQDIVRDVWRDLDYEREPDGQDHWKTSCETWEDAGGDCEDRAIAVYQELRKNGFPDEALGITIYSLEDGSCHAMANIFVGDEVYTLDGFVKEESRYLAQQGASIVFSFNLFTIWY